jgi:hypothetical protein
VGSTCLALASAVVATIATNATATRAVDVTQDSRLYPHVFDDRFYDDDGEATQPLPLKPDPCSFAIALFRASSCAPSARCGGIFGKRAL